MELPIWKCECGKHNQGVICSNENCKSYFNITDPNFTIITNN